MNRKKNMIQGTISSNRRFGFGLFLVFILISLTGFTIGCSEKSSFPRLKGPYLGQKTPGMTPELFAPGIIATDGRNELNSVFSPDGDEFYFSVYTPKPVDSCVIMVSKRIRNSWTQPEPVSFSGKGVDVDMAFGPDGNRLYFCSKRGASKHDIWFVRRGADNAWSEPRKVGHQINTQEGETYPTFTQRGRMYFSALRSEGFGGKDIYYSDQDGQEFTKPVNLGAVVNSQYEEGDTFVAPDESYLIFTSSGRPDSVGASDLYISFRKTDGSWTTAENLGKKINTEMYEYSPMVSPDGKYLFFSRFFEGKSDIYWVDSAVVKRRQSKESKELSGPYLGQQPPGITPELFAPGVVSKTGSRDLMHGFFDNGNLFLLYRYPLDFKGDWTQEPLIVMRQNEGKWSNPYKSKMVGKPWIYNLESVDEGEQVIFAWTKNLDGSGPAKQLYLWHATKTPKGWTEPARFAAPLNTGFETWPAVDQDKTLYFFSRREGGMGKADIYRSIPENGNYKRVQNLGNVINTRYIEEDPFIARDGSYLLFDSNRPGGFGGFDLYISWRKKDGTWTNPANLGQRVNSRHSECRAYVSSDGKYLFFSSNRNGDFDTWWLSMKVVEELRVENTSTRPIPDPAGPKLKGAE